MRTPAEPSASRGGHAGKAAKQARMQETAPRAAGRAGRFGPRRRTSIRWDRLGRVALLGTLVVILLLYLSPAKHWWQQSRTASAQREELRQLGEENRRLKQQVRALRDPGALEREARRLGMVRQGERAYVIKGLP